MSAVPVVYCRATETRLIASARCQEAQRTKVKVRAFRLGAMENQEWAASLTIDEAMDCIQLLEDCFKKPLLSGPFRQRERKIKQNLVTYDGC